MVQFDNLYGVKKNCSAQRKRSYHVVFTVRHRRGNYIILSLLSLKVVTPEMTLAHRSCHPCASPPHKRFIVGCGSLFMPLARHLTALRSWCKQCLSGRLKTRRAPSRHCRGARIYGHTTTAMHNIEYTLPPLVSYLAP